MIYLKRIAIPDSPHSASRFCFSRLNIHFLPPVISYHFHHHPYLCFSSSVSICQCPYSILFGCRYLSSYQSTQLYYHTHTRFYQNCESFFIRNVYPAVVQSMLVHSCWDFASLLAGQLCTPNFWFSALLQESTLEVEIVWAPELLHFSAFNFDRVCLGLFKTQIV